MVSGGSDTKTVTDCHDVVREFYPVITGVSDPPNRTKVSLVRTNLRLLRSVRRSTVVLASLTHVTTGYPSS